MMKTVMRSALMCSLASIALLAFSGCGEKKEADKEGGEFLVKVDGKVAMTQGEFQKILGNMARGLDPALLPKDIQKRVLEQQILPQLKAMKYLAAKAKKDGFEKNEKYKKAIAKAMEMVQEQVLVSEYQMYLLDSTAVTEEEIKAEFEANKNMYVKEQGGVLVNGVSFKDRPSAMAFYEKVKGNMDNFASDGRKEKMGTFREFGRVNETMPEDGNVPAAIKTAVLKLNTLPAIDLVKDGANTWVIFAGDKKESVPFDFEEIKDRIKDSLKMKKFSESNKGLMETIEKEVKVELNEAFFKPEGETQAAEVAPAIEQVAVSEQAGVSEEQAAPEQK